MVIATLLSIVLAAVDDVEIGAASGVLSAARSIAGSARALMFGSMFFAELEISQAADGHRRASGVQGAFSPPSWPSRSCFPPSPA
jgi:hypothetical protein